MTEKEHSYLEKTFSFVPGTRFAGSSCPGANSSFAVDVEFLKSKNITHFLSLMENQSTIDVELLNKVYFELSIEKILLSFILFVVIFFSNIFFFRIKFNTKNFKLTIINH